MPSTERKAIGFMHVIRDHVDILVLRYGDAEGWICVDGKPNFNMTFVWQEDKKK